MNKFNKRVLTNPPTAAPPVGSIKYQAESPDESALVCAAQVYGYSLLSRTSDWLSIHIQGVMTRYQVLAILPFDR